MLLALEVDLEILPFDCMQLLIEPDHAGIAVGGLLPAQKERALIRTVDDPVIRRRASDKSQQRGEHVGDVHHLVALYPRLDAAGPADQQRGANAAFRRAEIRAVKETARSPAGQMILGALDAAIDDDGLLGDLN